MLASRGEKLLGPEEVRAILDSVTERAPGLVEAVYPEPLSLAALTRLFRALVADGISLAHPQPILTSLALGLQRTQDFNELVDQVRIDLGAWIVGRVCPPGKPLKVATLEAPLEGALLGSVVDPATGQPMIEPSCGQMIAARMSEMVERESGPVAMIVQPPLRRSMATLLSGRVPQALVLSINELPASQPVEVLEVIGEQTGEQAVPPDLSTEPDIKPPEAIAA